MQQKQIQQLMLQFIQVHYFFGIFLWRVQVRFGLHPQYLTRPVPLGKFQFWIEIHVAYDDYAVIPSTAGVQHAENTVAVGSSTR